jgi:CBS domain-containing protein
MRARDVMTHDVVTVGPTTGKRRIAELLATKGISAVPVIDEFGAPIGIVSEGDLIGRDDADREARRDWWLTLLAEGETLSPEFMQGLQAPEGTARELMTAPLLTVSEDTDLAEVARLLGSYKVKRLPVVREGKIVGIVSRADLVRSLAGIKSAPPPEKPKPNGIVRWIDEHYRHSMAADHAPPPAMEDDTERLSVVAFRHLVADHQHSTGDQRAEDQAARAKYRRQRVRELIDHHITDEGWRALLHRARMAAERGETEFMLLRFPSQLCSDGGRAINAPSPDWPTSLRGEAAEIYLRWERDLKPKGFPMIARVLEFPDGLPGDIGLILIWGG